MSFACINKFEIQDVATDRPMCLQTLALVSMSNMSKNRRQLRISQSTNEQRAILTGS